MSKPLNRHAIEVFVSKIKLKGTSEISDFLLYFISVQCRYQPCQTVKILCCMHLCFILKKENRLTFRFLYRTARIEAF
jgi:hypothetical protein